MEFVSDKFGLKIYFPSRQVGWWCPL